MVRFPGDEAARHNAIDLLVSQPGHTPEPGQQAGPELAEALRSHALELLPDYMAPTDFVFHGSLPMTASGKIQRFVLRRDAGNN